MSNDEAIARDGAKFLFLLTAVDVLLAGNPNRAQLANTIAMLLDRQVQNNPSAPAAFLDELRLRGEGMKKLAATP